MEGADSQAFKIDKDSGVIKTSPSAQIDYESKQFYSFEVSATDQSGAGMKVISNITITVIDKNDNKPVFPKVKYNTDISEIVSIGYNVLRLNATDADSGYFGLISYRIVSGSDGKFSVDSESGVIYTEAQLDRETKSLFILNVSSYDGGLPANVAYCTVYINISDVNDNYPVFENTQNEVFVIETAAIGTSVARVLASDADLSDAGKINFSLSSDTFTIDTQTGIVRTIAPLDREITDKYTLMVVATDTGGHSSNTSLLVSVGDVNDNFPIFLTSSPLTIDVFEKTANGSIIAITEAVDKDYGMNGKVWYSISEKSGYLLSIDNKTGLIR